MPMVTCDYCGGTDHSQENCPHKNNEEEDDEEDEEEEDI
jgi:hypothetical protein